jgi:hypothetical protein
MTATPVTSYAFSASGAAQRELCALLAAARSGAASQKVVDGVVARLAETKTTTKTRTETETESESQTCIDAAAWVREWTAAGGTAWAAANHTAEAVAYLHAASYYAAALTLIDGADGWVDERRLWERQRDCWERAVPLLGGEHVAIPYRRTTLPGAFFSGGAGRRPLIVVDHGGRVATSQAWAAGGAAAHARGCHWMTFDGPGRQAALHRQGLVLRPDWEIVLEAVADAMLAREDVDPQRIAVIGLEHAGYGVARGVAHEGRFATAVLAPAILDASAPLLDELPPGARAALLDGDRAAFDRELHLAGLFAPESVRVMRRHAAPYGGRSLYDAYERIRTFRLGEQDSRIAVPTLVCVRAEDSEWPGQAQALYARLCGPKRLIAAQPGDDAVADWLDEVL